jgi:phosphatidylglycerophosphate synthase
MGVIAGICFSKGYRLGMLLGAAYLHMSFLLDNCDGEVARLKNLRTTFGKWFDLLTDLAVDFALWVGLAFGAACASDSVIIHILAFFACLGSTLNLGMVIFERESNLSTSIHAQNNVDVSKKMSLLDVLIHNGDVITCVWIAAIFASPLMFLIIGCVYINVLWLWRAAVNAINVSVTR